MHTSKSHCSWDDKLYCQLLSLHIISTRIIRLIQERNCFPTGMVNVQGCLTRLHIIRRIRQKEFCMVIFLCNNNHKFGIPSLVKELACLWKVVRRSELRFIHLKNKTKNLHADRRTDLYNLI